MTAPAAPGIALLRLLLAAAAVGAVAAALPLAADPQPSPGAAAPAVAVVLWHGMGDNCCLPFSMGAVKNLIEDDIKGAYVVSLMLGTNPADDSYNSYFMPVHKQLEMACEIVSSDPKLASGFHAIGFSQGGLFVRALAQTCPGARILNLISIGGPQQGIFGLPQCLGDKGVCEEVRKLLDIGAYVPLVQNRLVQAQYWHDPRAASAYEKYNVFLPGINNAGALKNTTYKERLLKINKMVLVKFLNDTIVVPRDSEWFGFYKEGQDKEVEALEASALYLEDWLGLKTLNEDGRLVMLSCLGNHLQV
jgi:palmitoyl-protein thioesterase